MLLHLLTALASATCPATSGDVLLALEGAESSFRALDLPGFRAATDTATMEVSCLQETLPREVVARLHRVVGLRAFVDGDAARATAAFASARAIEPSYRFPEALVPPDHPVQVQYVAMDPNSGARRLIPTPTDGRIEVDGRASATVPDNRPSVVQWVRENGSVPLGGYVWPSSPWFDYPVAPLTPQVPAPQPLPQPLAEPHGHTSRPLAIAAGAALVVGGGLYAYSAASRAAYLSDNVDPSELDALRARTNGSFWGAVGAGVTGVGLGATAVVVGKW